MKKEQLNSDVLQNPGGNSEVHVQISPVDEKRSEPGKSSFISSVEKVPFKFVLVTFSLKKARANEFTHRIYFLLR